MVGSSLSLRQTAWTTYNVFLLGFGTRYVRRYASYGSSAAEGEYRSAVAIVRERGWKENNQKEWDRISVALALVVTVHAACLAIQDTLYASWTVRALWIGGFGLSLAGLVSLSYMTVAFFNVTDDELDNAMGKIHARHALPIEIVAGVGATPVALMLWSTCFLVTGMVIFVFSVDYAIDRIPAQVPASGFRALSGIPILVGTLVVAYVVAVVEVGFWVTKETEPPQDSSQPMRMRGG